MSTEEQTRTVLLYKEEADWLHNRRRKGESIRSVLRRFRNEYEECKFYRDAEERPQPSGEMFTAERKTE